MRLGNIEDLEIKILILWEKTGTGKAWRSVLKILGNLEYGINIFQQTWNGNLLLWDQYLPTKHWMNFQSVNLCIFETLIRNFGTLELWNQESKKPNIQETNKPRNQTYGGFELLVNVTGVPIAEQIDLEYYSGHTGVVKSFQNRSNPIVPWFPGVLISSQKGDPLNPEGTLFMTCSLLNP